MLFNSYTFLFLFLLTFGVYYASHAVQPRARIASLQLYILLAASFIFYAWQFPILLLLLVFSVTINTYTSWEVHYAGKQRRRKFFATLGVVLNLSALAFFKYSPMFSRLLLPKGSSVGEFLLAVPLPIGISFFTFHGISMLVDVYRKKNIESYAFSFEKGVWHYWLTTSLYIAFFPQLIAGPITKAYNFLPQIKEKYFKDIQWESAFKAIVLGYFLKMVIADNLKDQTFWIAYPYFQGQNSWTLIAMLFGYSFQIFSDFAGYSYIAMGIAILFGYQLPLNFNFPYISTSFSEFWTRWHISLSSWLKEYLYIPLGGNKKGEVRTYINLMLVMFLGGLWHGAALSYAVWGSFHGLALAAERFFGRFFTFKLNLFVKILKALMVFVFVTFAWLLFKLPNFNEVVLYLQAMGSNFNSGASGLQIIFYILLYSMPVVLFHLYYVSRPLISDKIHTFSEPLVYGMMLFAVVVNSGGAGEFIYFQF